MLKGFHDGQGLRVQAGSRHGVAHPGDPVGLGGESGCRQPPFVDDLHRLAGARVTRGAGRATFDRERTKAAQFHTVTICQCTDDFIEHCVHNAFQITQIQVWIFFG